ncbi:hypothetical protein BC831DRAFT_446672 [Entophlyctis helioformis]|nr:hypothetical protein BC831DRAFT_446672 [Entophlyctis helioformis]
MSCCSSSLSAVATSSWTAQRSIDIYAHPERLWEILSNVASWPTWDDGLVSSSLDDPDAGVQDGAKGKLDMKERGVFEFTLVDLEPNQYFAYDVQLTGALTHWFWDFSRPTVDGSGVVLVMGVVVSGWAAPFYRYWIEKESEQAFERSVARLKDMAEKPAMRAASAPKFPVVRL